MVGPGTRAGARREPDVHLEAHAPVQRRQAERPVTFERWRDIRGAWERARDGPVANAEDEGTRVAALYLPGSGGEVCSRLLMMAIAGRKVVSALRLSPQLWAGSDSTRYGL
jgi:hypothetical protein